MMMSVLIGMSAAVQTPPVAVPVAQGAAASLGRWTAEAPRCGDVTARWSRAPDPASFVSYVPPTADASVAQYSFTVGAGGRPLDIKRQSTAWPADAQDVAPALAAALVGTGAKGSCTVRFSLGRVAIATAPIAQLFAAAARPEVARVPAVLARLKAAGGDCMHGTPAFATRAFPPFRTLPQTPGRLSWTVTRFDIDAAGRPVGVRTEASSGNAALDRAAVDAFRRSRFEPGAQHGCLFPTNQRAGLLSAPTAPEEAAFKPADATCPSDLPFATPPRLIMPERYRQRSIEGWAMIAYDVAPWGATGNIRVLAAEPSAEFGEWALNVLRGATKRASNTGYTGCVDRVRFVLGDQERLLLGAAPTPAVE